MAGMGSLGTLSARVALDTTPLSAGMKTAGLAFAAVAAGAAAAIYKVGSDYETSLNTFKAVSSATSAQMAQVGATAKALGADMSLPATSAADAAKAMTELAKAGLSVDETMAAAKGALQLAAAAGIDEGRAAEIAATALNAFGLKGSEAGRVADLLAAASSAASGEITDMAAALQMSSAVYAAARIPIEDLMTGIGLLAKNSIIGSDAGTSLKQMLLSLENPSKITKGVMQDIGLSIYDVHGRMVSFREIIERVTKSTKDLTEEQRNAALGQIFGSDAVRAMNVLIKEGVVGFDQMKAAVTRLNAAKELAEARTKGLKGAIEGLGSQLETFALTIYANVAPRLEKLFRAAAEGFPAFEHKVKLAGSAFAAAFSGEGVTSDGFVGVMERIGVAASGIVDWFKENWPRIKETFSDTATVIKSVADGIFKGIQDAGPTVLGIVGGIALAFSEFARLLADNKPLVETISRILTDVLIPAFVLLGIEAMASALKQAAAWVITHVQAVISAGIHVVQAGIVVAHWVIMGAVAMAQAAVMAAAWLISLGPIALLVAAVVGLAIVFVKNWDTIKSAVLTGVEFVVDKILGMAEWVTRAGAAAFGWVPGVGDKLQAAARAVEAFRNDVNAYLDGIRDKTVNVRVNHVDNYAVTYGPGYTGGDNASGVYAEGGIVDKPTFALIGEAGRELILPLTNMRRTFQLLAQAGLVKPFSMPAAGAPAAMVGQGASGQQLVQHIYPSAGMDERALGATAAREMAWAAGR